MKNKKLIWVYPPNNWVSNYKKTFVYGWSEPKTKLYVACQGKHIGLPIKIFPNGNFAQSIKLPYKKNVVRLVQILNGKRKIVSRSVVVRTHVGVYCNKPLQQFKKTNPVHFAKIPRNYIRIVIDPGHGGKEHGTHSPKGISEKYFNLQIAKLLYKRLKQKYKNVYFTRSKDKFVSLKQRVNFAKKKKANILISIHHNALPDNEDPLKHRGVGIYYTHDFVKPFAKRLLDSISKESGLKKYGIFKRDFAVTRPDFYAGILIECGFLIHPIEGEYITQRKVQEKIARGIAKTIS